MFVELHPNSAQHDSRERLLTRMFPTVTYQATRNTTTYPRTGMTIMRVDTKTTAREEAVTASVRRVQLA